MNPSLEFIDEYEHFNQDSNFILMPKQKKQSSFMKPDSAIGSNFKLKKQSKQNMNTSFSKSRRKCIDEIFPQINLKSKSENQLIHKKSNKNHSNWHLGSQSSDFDDLPRRFQNKGSSSSNEYETMSDLQSVNEIYPLEKLNILY